MENYPIKEPFLKPIPRTTGNIIIVDRKKLVQQDLDGNLHERPARFTNTEYDLRNLDDDSFCMSINACRIFILKRNIGKALRDIDIDLNVLDDIFNSIIYIDNECNELLVKFRPICNRELKLPEMMKLASTTHYFGKYNIDDFGFALMIEGYTGDINEILLLEGLIIKKIINDTIVFHIGGR